MSYQREHQRRAQSPRVRQEEVWRSQIPNLSRQLKFWVFKALLLFTGRRNIEFEAIKTTQKIENSSRVVAVTRDPMLSHCRKLLIHLYSHRS